MNKEINEKVFEIVREVFARPELVVTLDTTAADVQGWDSFSHMSLIVMIEESFGIAFETEEIGMMGRVGDLATLVEQKLTGV